MVIHELDRSAEIQDQNSIYYIWDELKRNLQTSPRRSKSMAELTRLTTPDATFEVLTYNLSHRVTAIIRAKSYPTSY
ncbi:hypothetical protein TNIN_424701 [Trichonephila inaurata madagascariensis]|uniref:Uncharacterized protein n=1 Tax=Trichonephila inaurata madagascariensis TaxID=2747483 RepID=A0A8X6Y6E2_9ARAC|nr:hypothetical protein TNIN_424701 [Trichonephila inaurata madagascariensis]